MADQRKALDQKTRKLASGDVDKGQEQAALQETQQQLMAIQAERNQNLAVARAESKASSELNQVLSQAAQVGVMTQETPQDIETPAMNPATQNTLKKFGVGQPKFQRSVSQSQQITKQNVVINNNTTNNTTNNVQVPANTGGPIQGRPLAFKTNVDTTGKFKAWISSAFARQSEEGARRDREYRQRENSLAKSAGKMMKRIEELGRSVSARMDPRRIGTTITSQIKTLLFVMGIGFMAQNWPKILEKVADIESGFKKFLHYLGIGVRGKSDFHKDIVRLLGGNEQSENAFQALRKLISNDDPQSPGMMQELSAFLHHKTEERREAMKLVKFPDLDIDDIPGTLKQVVGYLGDLLSAMVSGAEGIKNSISKQVERTATAESSQYIKDTDNLTKRNWDKQITNKSGEKKDADIGTLSLFEKGENRYRGLTKRAVDSSGELNTSYGAEATLSQGEEISRLLLEANQGKSINTAQLATGLRRLKTTADNEGKIPVSLEFINNRLSDEERRQLTNSKDIVLKDYKVVARQKTDEDYRIEDANPEEMAITSYITNDLLNSTKAGKYRRRLIALREAKKGWDRNGTDYKSSVDAGRAFGSYITGYMSTNPTMSAVSSYWEGRQNRKNANEYRIELVPELREGDIDTGETRTVAEISGNVIQKIADKLSGTQGASIDTGDQNFTVGLEQNLLSRKNEKLNRETAKINQEIEKIKEEDNKFSYSPMYDNSLIHHENAKKIHELEENLNNLQKQDKELKKDINVSETFEGINKLQALEQKHKKEREDTESRREKSGKEISKSVSNATDKAIQMYNDSSLSEYTGKIGGGTATGESKELLAYAVKHLSEKGNYTPEQAAGIVGNLVTESSLNPSAFNSAGGGRGAFGLAQWRGDRQAGLKAKYGSNPTFGEQLDYIIEELNSSERAAGIELKTKQSAEAAADSIRRNYERPGNEDLIKTLPKTKGNAALALKSWEELGEQVDPNMYSFQGTPSGSINSNEIHSSDESEGGEEPKSLFHMFVDNVKKFIYGGGEMISNATEKVKETVKNKVEELLPPSQPIPHYEGPITKEFTSYNEYLKNSENIESGLSYSEWANRVFDMTGSSPFDLIPKNVENEPTSIDSSKKALSPWEALTEDYKMQKDEELINKLTDGISWKPLIPEVKTKKEQLDQNLHERKIGIYDYLGKLSEMTGTSNLVTKTNLDRDLQNHKIGLHEYLWKLSELEGVTDKMSDLKTYKGGTLNKLTVTAEAPKHIKKERLDKDFQDHKIGLHEYLWRLSELEGVTDKMNDLKTYEGGNLSELTVTGKDLSKYLDPNKYETYEDYVNALTENNLSHKIISEHDFNLNQLINSNLSSEDLKRVWENTAKEKNNVLEFSQRFKKNLNDKFGINLENEEWANDEDYENFISRLGKQINGEPSQIEPDANIESIDKLSDAIAENTEATIGQTQVEAQTAEATGIEIDPENNIFSKIISGDYSDLNKDPKLDLMEKIHSGVVSLLESTYKINSVQKVGVKTTAKVVDATREGTNSLNVASAQIIATQQAKQLNPIDWNSMVNTPNKWGEFNSTESYGVN